MKKIIQTEKVIFGAYNEVLEIDNGYICDGVFLSTNVIGVGTIEEVADDYVNPNIVNKEKEQQNITAKEARAKAYQKESDSLFFKAQRGEATMEEWLNKVEQIKLRYPYK